MTITRIEIYPFYMLNDDEWIGKFIIDWKIRLLNGIYHLKGMQYPIEHYSNRYLNEIRSNVSNEIYELPDDKIKDFLEKLNDFKDIVSPNLQAGFPKVTHGCYFVFFSEGSSFVSYFLNKFTSNWVDFAVLIENLVGFDVLNINYSKKFITNICYDIQKEGIYDAETKRKLNLKKSISNIFLLIFQEVSLNFPLILMSLKCSSCLTIILFFFSVFNRF